MFKLSLVRSTTMAEYNVSWLGATIFLAVGELADTKYWLW